MHISYCETCGALVKSKKVGETIKCADCKAGNTPARTRGDRDSAMIPRAKIDNFLRTGRKRKEKNEI